MKPPALPRYPNARRTSSRPRAGVAGATVLTAILAGGLLLAPAAHATDSRENPSAATGAGTVSSQLTVDAPEAPAELVNTSTSLKFLAPPTVYGDVALMSIVVTPDGPTNLSGVTVTVDIGGKVIGSGVLLYSGGGAFSAFAVTTDIPAGTHAVVARFQGTDPDGSGMSGARASTSAPVSVTLAKASTVTTIAHAPSTVRALDPFTVLARVDGVPMTVGGAVSLLGNGKPLATGRIDTDGNVRFDGVLAPFGTTALEVRYDGDPAGNYATSVSAASPIDVTAHTTETELRAQRATVRVDESVSLTGTVANTARGMKTTPTGSLTVLVDGEPAQATIRTEPAGSSDAGRIRFDITLADLPTGPHEIVARFVPDPGFVASESRIVSVTVTAVETSIRASETELRGTDRKPAAVDVFVSALAARPDDGGQVDTAARAADSAAVIPVGGYVQAFVNGTPFGQPVTVENGRARLEFAGLAVGRHEIDVRFTPDRQGFLRSSVTVWASVEAQKPTDGGGAKPVPAGTGGKTPASQTAGATLPQTGPAPLTSVGLGAGVLFLAGGSALALGRVRRRNADA